MDIHRDIESVIAEIETQFQQSPGLILTESDLKCHIVRKLHPLFSHKLPTRDSGILASPLHTELAFYDEPGKRIIYRPDISIINTENLSILHSVEYKADKNGVRLKPTGIKQYEFGGNSIVMELKFCRKKYGITKTDIDSYIKDINKIKHLQSIALGKGVEIYGYFIVFNKTPYKIDEYKAINSLTSKNLTIIYKTGNVKTKNRDKYLHKFQL